MKLKKKKTRDPKLSKKKENLKKKSNLLLLFTISNMKFKKQKN